MSFLIPSLQKGQIIDVVSPGWATSPQELKLSVQYLKKKGLVPRVPKNIFKPYFLGSNTTEKRVEFLVEALSKTDSYYIWCLRGGYGSIHLLPALQKMTRPKQSKMLMGISDITSLHSFVNTQWGWPSWHSPLLDRTAKGLLGAKYEKELWNLLEGKQTTIRFEKLKWLNPQIQTPRILYGSMSGGNLTVFQSLIGTPYFTKLKGKIFFIEDLGERSYRIDRILEQLWQIGELQQAQALIFGDFLGTEDKDGKSRFSQLMKIWAQRLPYPVLSGLQAGHGKVQRPVPFGTSATLDLSLSSCLTIETGIKP